MYLGWQPSRTVATLCRGLVVGVGNPDLLPHLHHTTPPTRHASALPRARLLTPRQPRSTRKNQCCNVPADFGRRSGQCRLPSALPTGLTAEGGVHSHTENPNPVPSVDGQRLTTNEFTATTRRPLNLSAPEHRESRGNECHTDGDYDPTHGGPNETGSTATYRCETPRVTVPPWSRPILRHPPCFRTLNTYNDTTAAATTVKTRHPERCRRKTARIPPLLAPRSHGENNSTLPSTHGAASVVKVHARRGVACPEFLC